MVVMSIAGVSFWHLLTSVVGSCTLLEIITPDSRHSIRPIEAVKQTIVFICNVFGNARTKDFLFVFET